MGRSSGQSWLSGAALAVVAAAAIQIIPEDGFPSLTGEAAATKPFTSFESFYPYYKAEHTIPTNRMLHFIGTSIIIMLLLTNVKTALAGFISGVIGFILSGAFRGLPHGAYEGILMFVSFLAINRWLHGRFTMLPLMLPLIGYGAAWVGHFYFEHNRPATFIYPSYSLAGDLRMFANILMREESFGF